MCNKKKEVFSKSTNTIAIKTFLVYQLQQIVMNTEDLFSLDKMHKSVTNRQEKSKWVRVARWSYLKKQTRHRDTECMEGEGQGGKGIAVSSRLLGECHSSPSRVWGRAPATNKNTLGAFCTRETAFSKY